MNAAALKIRSLRWRLLGISLATIVLALMVSGAGLAELFSRHVERRAFAELENHARVLLASLDIAPDGSLQQSAPPSDPLFDKPYGGLYWQIGEGGKAVMRSRSLWDFEIAAPKDELIAGAVHHHRLQGPDGSSLLTLERPLRLEVNGSPRAFRVIVAIDQRIISDASREFNRDLALALAGLALVLFAASVVQAGLGLAPLSRLRGRLAEVRSGGKARLSGDAPQEVQPLIDEINGLLDQRDDSIARARSRAADLAHGLRTPLTALDGDVRRLRELGHADLANDIGGISELMRRHVQAELTRARIAGSRVLAGAPLLVRPAVEAIVAVAARLPEGQALRFDIDIDVAKTLRIDASDFDEIMGNLIENAVRHARSLVRVTVQDRGNGTMIEVADDGPGIAPEDRDRLLRRGESRDTRGSGAGLGLSIVSDVLEAYDCALQLGRSEAGGLSASFVLPQRM